MPKRLQHHCPQCKAIAKPSCVDKRHMVECTLHGATNAAYGVCHQCNEEAKRELNVEWKEGEKRREEELKRKKQQKEDDKVRQKNEKTQRKWDARQKRKSNSSSGSGSSTSGF
ncbi:hypothetical protein BR93DRAFT_967588 [Coniochaeta sp. PMI_546]|nr:hypothetical protein BR93DRAFT_967588 [Coniochaeta sp. PMI_546]